MRLYIYIDSLALGKGGAEYIASSMANEMNVRGHEVFLGYKKFGAPKYAINESIVQVPWSNEESMQEYRSRIIAIDPDLFFVFYFNRDLLKFYMLVHGLNIPFGMQECTNPHRIVNNNWKIKPIEKASWERELIASYATRIRMVMPGYENSFPEYIKQNVRAFPNFALSPKSFHIENYKHKRHRIINIGGMKGSKNIFYLLEAFSRIADEFDLWDIYIYGIELNKTKTYHKKIIDFIENKRLTNRVIFAGAVDNISIEYLKADIHVITSLSEGCPTCVLEAMAHKLPSIGIESCYGTNKLIQHKKNGFLVSSTDNAQELEIALRALMKDRLLCKNFGMDAYNDAKNFTPVETYDHWEKLFYEMSEYKNNPDRLLEEQKNVDYERSLHMKRSREKYFKNIEL